MLTGDTLFIGDVGRPDLRASLGWSAEQLASMLYDSLHDKLAVLPDETLVYPAHGAGSLCGKNLSSRTVSTVGEQRFSNYALAPMSRERFIEIVTGELPGAPPYFTYDAVLNARERPTLDQALERELRSLKLARMLELVDEGAQLLDTLDPAEFEGAHLRGAINVGFGGSYPTWCGTVLDPERPVVVIAERGREVEAATHLGRIGFDNVAGYLAGGMHAAAQAPELIDQIARVTAPDLAELLASGPPPLLLDVRTEREWQAGRIDGATNIPLSRLAGDIAHLPSAWPLVAYCATGYRSAIASSLIRRAGRRSVTDLVGGARRLAISRTTDTTRATMMSKVSRPPAGADSALLPRPERAGEARPGSRSSILLPAPRRRRERWPQRGTGAPRPKQAALRTRTAAHSPRSPALSGFLSGHRDNCFASPDRPRRETIARRSRSLQRSAEVVLAGRSTTARRRHRRRLRVSRLRLPCWSWS